MPLIIKREQQASVNGTLEVDPPTYGDFVASAVMPVETNLAPGPAPIGTVYVDGREAQLEVVTRNPEGIPDVYEVICLVDSGTTSATVSGVGTSGGGTLYDPDLSGVGLTIKLANVATPLTALLTGGVATVLKDGNWLRQTRYWSRFTNGSVTWGGVHFYVTQRADVDVILVDVLISNATCHPGRGASVITDPNEYLLENSSVDGDTYFDYIQWTGLPASWVARTYAPRDSMDLTPGQDYVVKPYANQFQQHLLPCRGSFVRRFALVRGGGSLQDAADELLELRGTGRMTGADSYYQRHAWGTSKDRMPDVAAFSYSGQNGIAAAKLIRQEALDVYRNFLLTGGSVSANGLLTSSQGSWQHPLGDPSPSASGGPYIGVHGWPLLVREEMLVAQIMHDCNLERTYWPIVHPDTGEPVTAHDLASINQVPGDQGKQPFNMPSGKVPVRDLPWMVAKYADDPNGTSVTPDEHKVMPDTRPWNANDPGHSCPYFSRVLWQIGEVGAGAANRYRRYDGQHLVRYSFTLRPNIWHRNCSVSKDLALQHAAFAQRANSPYYIMTTRGTSEGSVILDRDFALTDPGRGSGFARESAWLAEAQLIAHAIGNDGWRASNASFWDIWGENLGTRADHTTRTTQRIGYPNNNAPNPHESYGATDLVNSHGSLPTSNPLFYACQTFEMFFVHHVAWAAFKTVYEGVDTVNAARMRAIVLGMADAIFAVQTTPEGDVYDHTTAGEWPPKFEVVARSDQNGGLPLASFIPWAWYPRSGGPQSFPGDKTNEDLFHCAAYAYRLTGNTFWLDRIAQARGFNPASYTSQQVADDFVAEILGNLGNTANNTLFDNTSLQVTAAIAEFQ